MSSIEEMLAEETDRVETIDAAFELLDQLRNSKGAVRMILLQAHEDARKAVAALMSCDPEDAGRVRALQWQAGRFDELARYVNGILEAGRAAFEDLSAEQAAELETLIRTDRQQAQD